MMRRLYAWLLPIKPIGPLTTMRNASWYCYAAIGRLVRQGMLTADEAMQEIARALTQRDER